MFVANYRIVLLMICWLVQVGFLHCMGDSPNVQIEIDSRKREIVNDYHLLTGKEANDINLSQSLRLKQVNVHDINISREIIDAIDLIYLLDKKDHQWIDDVIFCYKQNSDWAVRIACVRTLGKIDPSKANDLAHEILNDKNVNLNTKLSVARDLVRRGELFGYPILREGLISDDEYLNKKAISLMKSFVNYDGKIYDDEGRKINLQILKKELANDLINTTMKYPAIAKTIPKEYLLHQKTMMESCISLLLKTEENLEQSQQIINKTDCRFAYYDAWVICLRVLCELDDKDTRSRIIEKWDRVLLAGDDKTIIAICALASLSDCRRELLRGNMEKLFKETKNKDIMNIICYILSQYGSEKDLENLQKRAKEEKDPDFSKRIEETTMWLQYRLERDHPNIKEPLCPRPKQPSIKSVSFFVRKQG